MKKLILMLVILSVFAVWCSGQSLDDVSSYYFFEDTETGELYISPVLNYNKYCNPFSHYKTPLSETEIARHKNIS